MIEALFGIALLGLGLLVGSRLIRLPAVGPVHLLKPGDRLAVLVEGNVSAEHFEAFVDRLRSKWPDVECVVFANVSRIEVVRKEETRGV